jgi:hypothetical protein
MQKQKKGPRRRGLVRGTQILINWLHGRGPREKRLLGAMRHATTPRAIHQTPLHPQLGAQGQGRWAPAKPTRRPPARCNSGPPAGTCLPAATTIASTHDNGSQWIELSHGSDAGQSITTKGKPAQGSFCHLAGFVCWDTMHGDRLTRRTTAPFQSQLPGLDLT